MVKADDLIKIQKEREKIKFITFDKIYINIEKRVIKASATNFYYIWFEIPCYIIGCPQYNFNDCKEYLINKLMENGFIVEFYEPNILLITWFPK
jgi:uncharacterized protein (DUF302 family)